MQLVGLGSDHTAHQRENLVLIALLQRLEASHHAHYAVFGALAHNAAIENDDIGFFRRLARFQAHLSECAF